ncbi:ATP-binding protein [Streptomyces sp. NPDC059900]|uniref:ATP-binding protein n=1 Tax=Streptomyces sp. NPDC059900 TaxID=3155816 RepID=UPI003440FF50
MRYSAAPGDRAAEPPADRSQALATCLRLSGDSEHAPGQARAYVGLTLADWGVAEAVRADLQLIVSELATNAVIYTQSPEITVEIILTDDEAAVSVGDHGPHRQLRAQQAAPDAEHGRGLLIVEALASRWEQRRDDAGGTTVRAGIDLPGSPAPPAALSSQDETNVPRDHP